MRNIIIYLIRAYQICVSPYLKPCCRYVPSCSSYALIAIRQYGVLKGGALAVKRILRCHPFAGSGYDPVPPINK